MAIFHDMVERFIKVFMDDFSVFGFSFDACLRNLDLVLQRCKETNLILLYKKGLFLDITYHKGIEVERAKIEIIVKLPPPTNVKDVRSF